MLLNFIFDKQKSQGIQECYRERKMIPELIKEFGVQIIPAPGGMQGLGGGFLVLDMETLEVKKYSK